MSERSLAEWLEHATQLHSQVIEMGLERVAVVWGRLRQKSSLKTDYKPRIVTVAGTNGKGSTVALAEALALQAGQTTGAYTSPHILRFNERIRLDGEDADDATLAAGFAAVESARGDVPLTYFEFTTLVAFAIFLERRPDIWFLEVGLGGRLDAVNVLDADVAVVTTVDLDHQDWLGSDRETIGREKAGILRPGIPVILGDRDMPASVTLVADKLGCQVLQYDRDFTLNTAECVWQHGQLQTRLPAPLPDLPVANIASAIQVMHSLGLPPDLPADSGFPPLALKGRFQRLPGPPEVVLDVAHNPHAARCLNAWLEHNPCEGAQVAVFSALRDKDIDGVVRALSGAFDSWYLFVLSEDRAAPKDVLQQSCRAVDPGRLHFCNDAAEALDQAKRQAGEAGRVVVFGSFYTVAEILEGVG